MSYEPAAESDRDRVGPYQLVKAIGAGGSARIDLARIDRAYGFQRHVVIKRPLEHLRSDPKAAASLRREAKIGARLIHPNLVSILDAGMHDGYDYLVLEYIHGGSLRTIMQTDVPARVADVSLAVALAIVCDVARGLHAAHELTENGSPLGLVHRDVSPGNVLVGLDGAVKLADFGIAKETRVQTLSGSLHGTVTYMAPEQCQGHAFDRRADVFSLGVILYELVTGSRLFWADNDVASLHRVLSGNVPRPRKLKPIATTLEEIIMTAIAHDQQRRFASALELARSIEAYAGQTGEILGARHIARWAGDVLGPREAPWIGGATIPDGPHTFEPDAPAPRASSNVSLVSLIEAMPEAEPPSATFGPTITEEVETQPRRGRTARHRWFAAAAVVAIGAGIAAALVMPRTDDEPRRAAVPAASAAPSLAPPARPASPVVAEPSPAAIVDLDAAAPSVASPAPSPAKIRVPPRKRREPAISEPPLVTAAPTPAPSPSPHPPKIEWNPTMLLPTDPGPKKQ